MNLAIDLQHPWIEETLASLSPKERIAQLIHVAAWSNKGEEHRKEMLDLVENLGIGGIIFFQGDPLSQANLTNLYQAQSKVPMLISIDGEWGLGMRLEESMSFPYQMTLAAMQDESLIYEMGCEIGRQCRRLGIHINYAPSVDINTESTNPVIGFRSFGEEKEAVSRKAIQYMRGQQEQQVLAVAKHFPGHGDTHTDSHFTLPVLTHSKARLEQIELYPFQQIFEAGVGGVMVGHIHVPILDPTPNQAASISYPITTELLQHDMGFQGLIFTDAMDMKGVSQFHAPGRVDALALLAGNDVLLYVEDPAAAIEAIEEAISKGEISQDEVDRRVRKQLGVKYWAGLDQIQAIETAGLLEDLHSPHALALNRQLTESSLTLIQNKHSFLPLKSGEKVALISLNSSSPGPFQASLEEAGITSLGVEELSAADALKAFDKVIIGIHGLNVKALNNFDISEELVQNCQALLQSNKAILVLFGSPYALHFLPDFENAQAILIAYQESTLSQQCSANALLGASSPRGQLPVSISEHYPHTLGISYPEKG